MILTLVRDEEEKMSKLLRAIVVIAVVGVVELAKHFIFKDQDKYKPVYTLAPIVLCAAAFVVIALIQKTDVWTALSAGAGLGFTTMGSYDLIALVLKGWKDKSPNEIVKEVEDIIGDKTIQGGK